MDHHLCEVDLRKHYGRLRNRRLGSKESFNALESPRSVARIGKSRPLQSEDTACRRTCSTYPPGHPGSGALAVFHGRLD